MTSFPGAGLARRRSSADWPASIVGTGTAAGNLGTAGTAARCQVNDDQLARRQLPGCRSTGTAARASRGNRGTMTSFAGAGLARRRSSAPRGPRHVRAVARCQVNDDQLARRQLPGCRSTGTAACASRGDRGTMTSLPALALPAVDRRHAARPRHTGRRRSSAPWGPWHDDQLPALALPAVDRRHHGHGRGEHGTCEPWGIPHTGRRRSSAPRGPQHVRAVARCQVNDD